MTEKQAEESSSTSSSIDMATQICNQIASVFTESTTCLPTLVSEIFRTTTRNGAVLVYGVGREGLMMRALCMRLSHLGIKSHCVFDMTTPPITHNDLLLTSSGPGRFSTVNALCGVAMSSGARVVLITARPELVTVAVSVVAHVPSQTMADDLDSSECLLPLGSLYEGALYVLFEMLVFELTKLLGQTPGDIRSRHTNLE